MDATPHVYRMPAERVRAMTTALGLLGAGHTLTNVMRWSRDRGLVDRSRAWAPHLLRGSTA